MKALSSSANARCYLGMYFQQQSHCSKEAPKNVPSVVIEAVFPLYVCLFCTEEGICRKEGIERGQH